MRHIRNIFHREIEDKAKKVAASKTIKVSTSEASQTEPVIAATPPPSPESGESSVDDVERRVHVSVVCCGGERVAETLTMIKSATATSDRPRLLEFHVFADDDNVPLFREQVTADVVNWTGGDGVQ